MIYNCSNVDLIESIIKHKDVFDLISDDASSYYKTIINPNILYLVNEESTGVIRVDPMNSIMCSVHIATLPELSGKTIDFVREAFEWGFKNTRYQKIIGMIPTYNERAIAFAKKVGFKQEGLLTKSFLKNWTLWDQVILSINKGDMLWQQ